MAKSKRKKSSRAVEFDAIYELLNECVDLEEADELQPCGPQAVYRTSVVLWMLILQRLEGGCSLAEAVKRLLKDQPELLPENKRLREEQLSESTGAYSAGRQRLNLDTVTWLVEQVSQSLIESAEPSLQDRRVFTLDGTTLALRPEWDLREAFPPASNQYGESPWPIAHLVVAHEVGSGAALPPEVGAMYGDQAISETRLIDDHLSRLPEDSVVLADAAYGITRVAYALREANLRFVLRLKKERFQRLRRKAEVIDQGRGWASYRVEWTPTARELKNNQDLPKDFALPVSLHEVTNDHGETIYLATDMPLDADESLEVYSHRWTVETDIRQMKVSLDTESIRAKTKEMFLKELMTSAVAYNLTIQFRRQAAKRAKVPPRRLSFTGVWDVFRIFLLEPRYDEAVGWREAYERALTLAAKQKLPNRPGRSEPRQAYKRRLKSTHFQKRIPPWKRDQNKPK